MKNFFLMSDEACYIITSEHSPELAFYKYANGQKNYIGSIIEVDGKLIFFTTGGKETNEKVLSYPTSSLMMPHIVQAKKKLMVRTDQDGTFIVWNMKYGEVPVSNAVIFFKKREHGNQFRVLCTVSINQNGDLIFDFMDKEELS